MNLQLAHAYCFSDSCRQKRTFARRLKTAPVFACVDCGSIRELSPQSARNVSVDVTRMPSKVNIKSGYGAHNPPERTKRGAMPLCGCCSKPCRFVGDRLIRTCACDPDAQRCPLCRRAACHCLCKAGAAR